MFMYLHCFLLRVLLSSVIISRCIYMIIFRIFNITNWMLFVLKVACIKHYMYENMPDILIPCHAIILFLWLIIIVDCVIMMLSIVVIEGYDRGCLWICGYIILKHYLLYFMYDSSLFIVWIYSYVYVLIILIIWSEYWSISDYLRNEGA